MNNQVLLFDFDGTIADTFTSILAIINRLADEFNFNAIEPDEIDALKDKTSQEIVKHLKVPIMKLPMLIARGKIELEKEIRNLQPADGLSEVLPALQALGFQMGILSSNSLKNVNHFLEQHNLHYFDFINTTPKIWSKNTCLKNLIKSRKIPKENILYIGDETRDIAAAQKVGIPIIAVTWGYNSLKVLEAHNPDYLLNDPQELVDLCTPKNS